MVNSVHQLVKARTQQLLLNHKSAIIKSTNIYNLKQKTKSTNAWTVTSSSILHINHTIYLKLRISVSQEAKDKENYPRMEIKIVICASVFILHQGACAPPRKRGVIIL